MLKKQSPAEIAANKARTRSNIRAWLVFWICAGLVVLWLTGYAKGLHDGVARCTIFESICENQKELES